MDSARQEEVNDLLSCPRLGCRDITKIASRVMTLNRRTDVYVLLSFLISLITWAVVCHSQPIAQTRYGDVRGKQVVVKVDHRRVSVSTFLGIPFAKPPVDHLRFASPQPPEPWRPDIKDTQNFGPSCFHLDDNTFPGFRGSEMWNAPNRKSEDCLYLNVWTTNLRDTRSRPLAVMVWIFGGSFFSGTPSLDVYDGKYLAAAGDVVIVSINYRIGPLGFLPPLARQTAGNAGLHDQNLALQWIRDNIAQFGGDPNKVTLFGESAGATSIGLHGVSPLSRGLFNRVILQSGTQMAPWASISLEVSLQRTRQLASNVMCENAENISEDELLQCLRSKNPEEIFNGSWVTTEIFDFPFVPVHRTAFLPMLPQEMTRRGRQSNVDVLAGFNSNEGFYFTLYTIPGFNKNTDSLITEDQYDDGVALCGLRTNEFGRNAAAFMYKDWKFPDNPAQYRDALDNIVGHFHIVCPVTSTVKWHSFHYPKSNVYLYHLSYRLSNNPWPSWMGVMHGYEIELVFGLPLFHTNSSYNEIDKRESSKIIRMWTNFAKFGNPNGLKSRSNNFQEWPKYNQSHQLYIEINGGEDILLRSPTPVAERCAFWENYIPSLELTTSEISTLHAKWMLGYNRWARNMDSWETLFEAERNEEGYNDGAF